MGTAKQWIDVAVAGVIWTGFMILVDLLSKSKARISFARVLSTILMGFWFGLVATFGWQAARAPLIYPTIAAFVGSVLVGFWYRKNRSREQAKIQRES